MKTLLGFGLVAAATAAATPFCAAGFLVGKPLEILARRLPEPADSGEVWEYRRVGNRIVVRRTVALNLKPGEAAALAAVLSRRRRGA